MYLKLIKNSYVKLTPDKKFISFYLNGIRSYIGINESASDILILCDGSHTEKDIVKILSAKFSEDEKFIKKYVNEFLNPFIKQGIIELIDVETKYEGTMRGSLDVYYSSAICWEITNYCPLNCKHCYLPEKNQYIASRENIKDILKLIDDTGVFQVQLTGGEVLLHPQLEYIIHALIDRGIITILSTSGFGYKKEMFQFFKKLIKVKGSMLRVSLDGNESIHNSIRRNENAYKMAVEFIKEATLEGIPCQVETSMINQTEKELEELICVVKQLGVNAIEIGRIVEQGNAQRNGLKSQWTPSKHTNFLYAMAQKYDDDKFHVKIPKKEEVKTNCGAGYNIIRIKSNFDITPCPIMDFKIGNLYEDTYFNIAFKYSKRFQEIQAPNSETCLKCKAKNICKDCMAIGFDMKGKMKECFWYDRVKSILCSS